MMEIIVELKEESGFCHLLPKYDFEADILEITSDVNRAWTYGIDINGNLVIDLDQSKRLANIDFLIPKKSWQKLPENVDFFIGPRTKKLYDVYLTDETINAISFNLAITAKISNKNELLILIGENFEGLESYNISTQCAILVFGNVLKGFFVKL